jgi:polyisoprenoid-binding protein YceI
MNPKSGIAIAASLLALHASALADNVDHARSQISFVSKQMNVPVDGQFARFTAHVTYDPRKPAASKAEIEVELASVETGSSEANIEVAKKTWFNIAAFPSARFVSSSVRALSQDKLEVKGSLSIKGISREVTFPVTVKTAGGSSTFEGAFPILRLQYRIGEGAWSDTDTVADEVQVRFRIVTTGNK